jgi:plasmid stabilization system protein ParE
LARIVYSAEAFQDLDRIIEFLLDTSPAAAGGALDQIVAAVTILGGHPRIGRRVDRYRRELVISHGATGYIALYRYDDRPNVVRILRIRHQREAGYRD